MAHMNLQELMGLPNITEVLKEQKVKRIGLQIKEGFNEDQDSMEDWLKSADKGLFPKYQNHEHHLPII